VIGTGLLPRQIIMQPLIAAMNNSTRRVQWEDGGLTLLHVPL
jgi:hypothetical protein